MLTQNKRLITIMLSVGLLLLIPLIGMQFSNDVNWTVSDFLVAGGLLLGAGLTIEIVIRTIKKKQTRILLILIIAAILLLTWAELAVGVFGTPFAGS
ncbi:hypothetical protein [Hanstruepera ponticola]|uniref:hypothetical protein n=1 Tax=Hanstruepera ponticola TaxID=2042995 RepID=UPI000CF0F2EF|nr:hypothetical protein [Hanstruepera ponticola]